MAYGEAALRAQAERELDGRGDANLGEWREYTGYYHLRRRLSAEEEKAVGPVADIRGSYEARKRAKTLKQLLTLVPAEVLVDELGTESP